MDLKTIVNVYALEDSKRGKYKVGEPFFFYAFGRRYVKPFRHTGPIIEVGREPLWRRVARRLWGLA